MKVVKKMCAERFFKKSTLWITVFDASSYTIRNTLLLQDEVNKTVLRGIKILILRFYQVKWKRVQLKSEIFLLKVSIGSKFEKWSVLFILHTTFAGFFHSCLQFLSSFRIKNGYVELNQPFLVKFFFYL